MNEFGTVPTISYCVVSSLLTPELVAKAFPKCVVAGL